MTRTSRDGGSLTNYKTSAGVRWEFSCTVKLPGGARKRVHKRGFKTKTEAKNALAKVLVASAEGEYAEPSKQLFGAYLAGWLDGLSLRGMAPSTIASYRKNVRLHIMPSLGAVPLAQLTADHLDKLYVQLATTGRRDGQGDGLSPRTVRYVHTIISAALRDAAKKKMVKFNPAADVTNVPTAKAAQAPEMHPWTAAELAAFLAWAKDNSEHYAAWFTLACTGARRGELLGLRWSDVDLATGTLAVKRSATLVRVKGQGYTIETTKPKSGKPRVVDLDPATVAVLKQYKSHRGSLHLSLVQPGSLVFGDCEGHVRHPEHFSRMFAETQARCRRDLGEDAPPAIRLHDLRHTHASLMLAAGTPVKVVSERLGHASAVVTMTVYAHVLPGSQKQAAEGFAALVAQAES